MNAVQTVTVADIALVGLGEIGERFLEEMLKLKSRGVRIVCVAELDETPGKARALAEGIPAKTLEEIVEMHTAVDVIFDLTGSPSVRKMLRQKMQETNNRHTIIAPETMARLLWAVVSEEILADVHGQRGY